MRVCFVSPGSENGVFYGNLARWMRAAADDLEIQLEVLHCRRDPRRVAERGEALFNRRVLPEYLVLTNYGHLAVRLLPRAVAAGMKVFLINEGLLTADQAKLGKPRGKLPLWLGQLLPDDFQAGHALADRLIEEARRRGLADGGGTIHLCAITGDFSSSSVARVSGLRAAVREHDDVVLEGVHPASWNEARAEAAMATQLVTYPRTAVAWVASDLMATGAIRAIRAAGQLPGEELLVGGVDWAPFVPARIAAGELTASAGGHFMGGAWAMVMLYDHHHGYDFDAGAAKAKFVVLTRENLSRYEPLFDDARRSQVEFSRFSKAVRAGARSYDFTLEAVAA